MKVEFKDDSFAFGFVRNLGFMYYWHADLGEMMVTAGKINEGDFESWFTEWDKMGPRLLARADDSLSKGHLQSAREGFLRASTYFRTAEFYLREDPEDPRILSESRASQEAYAEAARLIGPTWEPIEIPYEGTTLPGYFYKVDNSCTPRPTLVFHGGYDSSLEELFFFDGAGAVRRGYNCLTFDGPGQGAPWREQKLSFRFDWEKVVTPTMDYALTRPDVDGAQLALMGMSMGGYLAGRAVAFEHRFCAAIFFDGLSDFHEVTRALMPAEAVAALDVDDAGKFEQITRKGVQHNTMKGMTQQIQCPCLVMKGEGDMFTKDQPQKMYDALRSPKRFARFTSEDGAENHSQSGAVAYKDEIVYNWLDETLKL